MVLFKRGRKKLSEKINGREKLHKARVNVNISVFSSNNFASTKSTIQSILNQKNERHYCIAKGMLNPELCSCLFMKSLFHLWNRKHFKIIFHFKAMHLGIFKKFSFKFIFVCLSCIYFFIFFSAWIFLFLLFGANFLI